MDGLWRRTAVTAALGFALGCSLPGFSTEGRADPLLTQGIGLQDRKSVV